MKRICVWVACFSGFAATAAAIPFHGVFTETITFSSTPAYSLGESFYGQYYYNSPSVDGTFDVFGSVSPLKGMIFMPFVARPGESVDRWSSLWTMNVGKLVVVGGSVASFEWSFEHNGYYFDSWAAGTSGYFNALSYYDRPIYDPATDTFEPTPEVRGTLAFGAPVVPDKTTTLGLLAFALVGLMLLKWRRTARGGTEEPMRDEPRVACRTIDLSA